MKLTAVLLARVVQLAAIKTPLYFPKVAAEIQQRYGFVAAPQSPAEILSADGTLFFQHGTFRVGERDVLIEALRVGRQGMVIDLKSSTEDGEAILTDLVYFAIEAFDLKMPEFEIGRLFISQLEVELNIDLERALPALAPVVKYLTDKMALAGPGMPMAVSSIGIAPDTSKYTSHADIRVERRQSHPWESNLYFCQAPIPTKDHLELLSVVEEALGAKPISEDSTA